MLIVIAIAAGVGLCHAQDRPSPRAEFEVATIKPSTSRRWSTTFDHGVFTAIRATPLSLVKMAYHANDYEVAGAPAWADAEFFDILAKAPADKVDLGFWQAMPMLQSLLEDRFKLVIHRERKAVEGYELVAGKAGVRLRRNDDDPSGLSSGRGRLLGQHLSLGEIAGGLAKTLNVPVADATGIDGYFDVDLRWRPDDLPVAATDDRPTVFGALQEIGLKLQAKKVDAEVIVIDRLERTPTEN